MEIIEGKFTLGKQMLEARFFDIWEVGSFFCFVKCTCYSFDSRNRKQDKVWTGGGG